MSLKDEILKYKFETCPLTDGFTVDEYLWVMNNNHVHIAGIDCPNECYAIYLPHINTIEKFKELYFILFNKELIKK